ncbi:MAG: MBL fold metallo-hydrolase [Parvibaculaceae bacterium]
MAEADFHARIWGARGSVPAAPAEPSSYGANTACVEVRCGSRTVVLDAGTGIVALGLSLLRRRRRDLDLFFTHCHYDHIEGLPFFRPLHRPDWTVKLWAGHMAGRMSAREMVQGYMRQPYFPIGPDCFAANVDYRDFSPGDALELDGGIAVRTARLNHPGDAVGYRVDYRGHSICYVTDTEHVPGELDANVLDLIRDADAVIYDAAYTDEDFARYAGYGHSTWQEGVRLCETAGAKRLIAFHHRPDASDAALAREERRLGRRLPGSVLAREGLTIVPGR